jgi:membrane protein implicated in regulation of membrane protease activity
MIHPCEVSLVLGTTLLGLEMLTGIYVSLSLGIGLLGVSLVEVIGGGFFVDRDVLVFGVVTVLSFVLLRKVFGRKGDTKVIDGDVNQF